MMIANTDHSTLMAISKMFHLPSTRINPGFMLVLQYEYWLASKELTRKRSTPSSFTRKPSVVSPKIYPPPMS